jgi:predicted nucleic acid-binding protein
MERQKNDRLNYPGILIDSSVLVEILTGNQLFSEKLSVMMKVKKVYINPLSISEILSMIDEDEKILIDRLFERMNVLSIDGAVSSKAGELLRRQAKKFNDDFVYAILAASALHFELKIWTVKKEKYPFISEDFFSPF